MAACGAPSAPALPPQVVQQLVRELNELTQKPADGITVHINEDNITDVQADIEGPADTPFEGGVFRMKLVLSADFPQNAPKGYFLTKVFHPNIKNTGEICVNTLKRDWKPTHGLRHVLMVIRCLLIEPFPESALNEEAAKLLLEDYEEYFKRAKMFTAIHAKKDAEKRGMPLSQNLAIPNAAAAEGADAAELASPSAKKAKGEKKLDKKRSLKRL